MTVPAAPKPPRTTPRLDVGRHFPTGYQRMAALSEAVSGGPLDPFIAELVKLRASQINGCAYCIDMHTKDARAMGESDERMHLVGAWREASQFSERERAALALVEAITLITEGHVPDDVWAAAEKCFEPDELSCLVWQCVVINAWNRMAITNRSQPGIYRSNKKPIERAAS
jgi:AhpD family alkylhydroperoxidase